MSMNTQFKKLAHMGNLFSKYSDSNGSVLRIRYMTHFLFLNHIPSLYQDVNTGLIVPASLISFLIQRKFIWNKYRKIIGHRGHTWNPELVEWLN